MSKSVKEIYPLIEKFVSKEAFTWITKDCLSREDIEKICQGCRIELLDSGLKSKGTDQLAKEIALEFFKNPKARELIIHYLNHATSKEAAKISGLTIQEILSTLREAQSPFVATGQVGKFLWSIVVDERPEALTLIPLFILKVLETIRKYTQILQNLRKDSGGISKRPPPLAKREPTPLERDLSSLQKELEKSKDELAESRERVKSVDEKLTDLQKQFKTVLQEVQELKHEKNLFVKKIKELEQIIENERRKSLSSAELQQRLHQLERENKSLKYDVEKKAGELEGLTERNADTARLQKVIGILEKRKNELETLLEEKNEEILKIKEVQKQEDLLRKATRKVFRSSVPRVGIFVDVQNIYYAARERFNAKVDFQRLLHEVLGGRRLVRATAYIVKTAEINQDNFTSLLEDIGYEIKARSLKIRFDGSAKGDWDLGIAIDTMTLADKLDVVVIVSGDGDFVDLVRMLKSKNIRVEAASFPHNTSGDLVDAVDFHFLLDEKFLLPS